jgi:hypothetical protein
MRTIGYAFVGWILVGFIFNGLVVAAMSGGASLLVSAAGVGALVWLFRSYRRGPVPRPDRIARLEAAFPEDPLNSSEIVNAWGAHVHDAEALERLRASYERTRRRLLAGDAEYAEEYLRSVRLLASEAPELVDRAVEEHGRAARAVEAALDDAATETLLAADARLQGARDALRRDEERPLEALRLASEAEQLAALPRELAAAAVDVEQVRDAVLAAAERHPESALAEVRGLPALAREEVDRARALGETQDVDDALDALTRARAHARRVTEHLERLERAAATGRARLHAAEAAIDAGAGERNARAAELVAQARKELEAARPNWLEIVALAERAIKLVGEARVELDQNDDLAEVRRRARDARDEALAWAVVRSADGTEILPLAAAADDAFHEAEQIADDGLALAAFRRAEAFAQQALAQLAPESGHDTRRWAGEVTIRWRGRVGR